MKITVEMTLSQALALQAALDLYVDMEGEREKDGEAAGFGRKDADLLKAARSLQKIVNS